MSDNGKKIEIDLQRKETEAGWIAIIDRFSLQATPRWFNWVAWLFALGAIHFLHDRSPSIITGAILGISYLLLFSYFFAFFCRYEIRGIPFLTNPKLARLVSLVISGILAFSAWQAAIFIAREIARFQQVG